MTDLASSAPEIEDPIAVSLDPVKVRARIRKLISQFMERPRPLPPSDADLLNEFLAIHRPQFGGIVAEVSRIKHALNRAKASEAVALERQLNERSAQRSDIVANAAVSEEFLTFRSLAKAQYNEALGAFEDEEESISALKPYLGMPHLPAIETHDLSAKAILAELTRMSPASPKKGQMVLQEPEDVHLKPQFMARSALSSGLHARLTVKRKMVGIPFAPTSTAGVEAGGLGAVERQRKMHFLIDGDRPVGRTAWGALDDYLPYAFRSLSVPMLPMVEPDCSQFSFAEVFGLPVWRQMSTAA